MSFDDTPTIEDDEARRRVIEEMMRLDRPRYFRDEAVQQEYRDILGRQEARQQGRERSPLAPGVEVDPMDLLSLDKADRERIDDPRVLSDVTPDSDWTPGAQYAGRKRTPDALRGILDDKGERYYRPQGHHEMPGEYYRKWKLQPEVAEIFKGSTTGYVSGWIRKTPDGSPIGHYWSPLHQAYNDAVEELALSSFFPDKGILLDGSNMTPPQALELLELIRLSEDPRIRDFNYNIRRLQRAPGLRGGRGVRGGGDD
jgi:hypothetical protein